MHKALWKMVKDSNMCAHTHTHMHAHQVYMHTLKHTYILCFVGLFSSLVAQTVKLLSTM